MDKISSQYVICEKEHPINNQYQPIIKATGCYSVIFNKM